MANVQIDRPSAIDGIRLADYITGLRAELAEASRRLKIEQAAAASEPALQSLDVVDIELQLEVAVDASASGKVEGGFWVILKGEAGAALSRVRTQRVTLKLRPSGE